jgi:hypothetical protein
VPGSSGGSCAQIDALGLSAADRATLAADLTVAAALLNS